jgi:hypothetical protein
MTRDWLGPTPTFRVNFRLLVVMLCTSSNVCDIISSSFSCIAYSNLTCIPRQSLLSSIAGQSQYLMLLPKRSGDGGGCDATCASSLPLSASIGGVNGTYRFDSSLGVIILEWKDPNTYKVSGITSLRAFVGTDEVSNSPLSVSMSPGPEALDHLVLYGPGSSGGTVNSNISL